MPTSFEPHRRPRTQHISISPKTFLLGTNFGPRGLHYFGGGPSGTGSLIGPPLPSLYEVTATRLGRDRCGGTPLTFLVLLSMAGHIRSPGMHTVLRPGPDR